MRNRILIILLFALPFHSFAQKYATAASLFNEDYKTWVKKGDSLYGEKKYLESGKAYSKAFSLNGDKRLMNDEYSAACSWAMAGYKDSAFNFLEDLGKSRFRQYNHLMIDPDLEGLHNDLRWPTICEKIKNNRTIGKESLNIALMEKLDTVIQDDQRYRMRINGIKSEYGSDSKEMQALWKVIEQNDSVNVLKVIAIIDQYGWPGSNIVGSEGSNAVFLVIQHADTKVQEKYLPVMREAVKNKIASASSLALLEDRVALAEGRQQIYGSQVGTDKNGHEYVEDLEDPDNVDKRRASVGLGPLATYLEYWHIKWDVEEYKKQQASVKK